MKPKCSLQYSQQPTNVNYTDTTLRFFPTPINCDYSLFLTYPQSSHKGERYKPWNDSLFKTDSRKYKFYTIIFTMLFTIDRAQHFCIWTYTFNTSDYFNDLIYKWKVLLCMYLCVSILLKRIILVLSISIK